MVDVGEFWENFELEILKMLGKSRKFRMQKVEN
jgi:hypothetical protein